MPISTNDDLPILFPAPPMYTPEQRRELRRQRFLDAFRAQVGHRNEHCDFGNYVPADPSQQKALEILREPWWANWPFLTVFGKPGVGKTHLAVASCRAYQAASGEWDDDPVFATEADFLRGWREAAANRTRFDGIERLQSRRLVVLDDVGTGKYTDGSMELMYQVIDHRYRHELPTLFTSNYAPNELEAKLGEKLVSRMLDRAIARVVKITGPNYRVIG